VEQLSSGQIRIVYCHLLSFLLIFRAEHKMELLEGETLHRRVILDTMLGARETVWIATANVKDCRIERDGEYRSIVESFAELCGRGVEVRLLHSGIPSASFRESLKQAELVGAPNFRMRRCSRVHFKAILVDDRHLYLGSANLTGAGLGAKSGRRRNFEIGILSQDQAVFEHVARLFHRIWEGEFCGVCGHRDTCYVPLEEPE